MRGLTQRAKDVKRTGAMASKLPSRSVERIIDRMEESDSLETLWEATGSYSTPDVAEAIQLYCHFRGPRVYRTREK